MEDTMTTFTLNNGLKVPSVGLGTCRMLDPSIIANAVDSIGYRLYDTASYYKNEEHVGEALK